MKLPLAARSILAGMLMSVVLVGILLLSIEEDLTIGDGHPFGYLAYQHALKYVRDTDGNEVTFSSDDTQRYHRIGDTTFLIHAHISAPVSQHDARELGVILQSEEIAEIYLHCGQVRILELDGLQNAEHPLELFHDPFRRAEGELGEVLRPDPAAPMKFYGICGFRLPEALDAVSDFLIEFPLVIGEDTYVVGMELLTK